MRNPERWRNAAIAVFLAGPAMRVRRLRAAGGSIPDNARGAMFAIGIAIRAGWV
jgi:hypothetical protein